MTKTTKRNKILLTLFAALLLFALYIPIAQATTYSENIIPIMTSNTKPSGVASGYNLMTEPFKAFDSTYVGQSENVYFPPAPFWIGYEFPTPRIVTRMVVYYYGDLYRYVPENYKVEAFNEVSGVWDELYSGSSLDFGASSGIIVDLDLKFDNSQPYKKYRFNAVSVYSDEETVDGYIHRITMHETLDTEIPINDTALTQEINFFTPKTVNKIKFDLYNINSPLPSSSYVEGFNESTGQWVNVGYTGSVNFGSNELTLTNSTAYKKYRLKFNGISAINLTNIKAYGY